MTKPNHMPTTKPAKASDAIAPKCFSLVPALAQQQMFRTLTALKLPPAQATGAEIAEIAVSFAIGENDPVLLACGGGGARVVRKGLTAARGKDANSDGRLTAATVCAVTSLLGDAKATVLVCGGRLRVDEDYRSAFGFAARHKLPILYLISNSLTPGKRQELDLRTLYAEFGIPVFSIDAHDAIAAYRVATEALHNARHGRGPAVIEALTFGDKEISRELALDLLRGYMARHDNRPVL